MSVTSESGHHRRWRDWSISTKGLIVVGVPLISLIIASTCFFITSATEHSAQDWVTHTEAVRGDIERVHSHVLDGVTGIRGYLLTGDRAFLQPMINGRDAIGSALTRLETLVSDNPLESSRVAELRRLLRGGYQFSLQGIPGPTHPIQRLQWISRQRSSTDAIRKVLASMTATEASLLASRERRSRSDRNIALVIVGTATGLGILAGILLMIVFTRDIAARVRRLVDEADRLHDRGDLSEVEEGGDELSALSRHWREAILIQRSLESQAREAREIAEAASNEKSRFLSRMSHELRTPLNAVLGFAQLLELDATGENLSSLQQIRRAGRHLLDLINEVLDISRIESGTMTLSSEPVQVGELVAEVESLMAPLAGERGVIVASVVGNCPYYVVADRQRLKQVMLNLISNAIKYNRPGGTVRCDCTTLADGRVRIDVADTGIGISEEDLTRLFTPFERFGDAQGEIEGSGIGLVLARHLITAMSGELYADSLVGVGSTFSVILPPADERTVETSPEPVPATRLRAEGAGDGQFAQLLYIEDNISNVKLVEQILRRRPSWHLTHAGHGHLGLELVTSHSFDLILLDLHLPDMPGMDVLRHLRTRPEAALVPVVVVSADATPGQVDRLLAAGATAYITKPIDVTQVLQLLDETLHTSGAAGV